MTAIRNNTPAEDTYLDAARACILDVGVRRTTITDIARRAGVARMTIYRSWPDMPALLGDLMVREWLDRSGFDGETTATEPASAADLVVRMVRSIREDAFFRKIVDVDPEFMLPYVFQRRGRTQDHLLGLLVPGLTAAQDAGTVRRGDPEVIARGLLLAAQGFLMSMHTMTDGVSDADLDAELRLLTERYLAP